MSQKSALSGLISAVYEAAVYPEAWSPFLERFAEAVRGEGTVFLSRQVPSLRARIHASTRIDPGVVSLYETEYAMRDLRAQSAKPGLTPTIIRGPFEVCSEEELLRSDFYNEFMKPNDIFHDIIGLIPTRGIVRVVCSMRSGRRAGFGDRDVALLQELMPHFEKALQLHDHIRDARDKAAWSVNALDHWHVGWLLVDAECQIKQANKAAQTILAGHQGLCLSRGRLTADLAEEATRLRQAVRAAVYGTRLLSSMLISRPATRPLSVLVSGVRKNDPLLLSNRAAIFVTDPASGPPPSFDQIVRQLYGLTPTEAKMAAHLVRGKGVRAAAEELHISFHTARDYVQRIFSKTGVRRQSDLARLLLTSTAQIDPPIEG